MEVIISPITTVGMGISAAVGLFLPIVMLMFWKHRTKVSLIPFIVGISAYIAIAIVRGVASGILLTDGLKHSPWLYYLLMALISGVVEETARYIVFRYVLKQHDDLDEPVAYAIAHGGFEIVAVYGFGSSLIGFLTALEYRFFGIEPLISGSMTREDAIEFLQKIADTSFLQSMSLAAECFISMAAQIALTLLVFAAVRFSDDKKRLFLAVGLHTLMNYIGSFSFIFDLSIPERMIISALTTGAVCLIVWRVYSSFRDVITDHDISL